MIDGMPTRAVLIGRDATVLSMLTASLTGCGVQVIATLEDLDRPIDGLHLKPDLIVVEVRRGSEMHSYHIGHGAAECGIAVLFAAPDLTALAVESLVSAVPCSVLVDLFCSQEQLAGKIAEALGSRDREPMTTATRQ